MLACRVNYTRAEKPTGENGSTSSLPMVEENHRGLCYNASDWVRIEPNRGQDGHFLCFHGDVKLLRDASNMGRNAIYGVGACGCRFQGVNGAGRVR